VQAAGLQGIPPTFLPFSRLLIKFAAVRKNRYVILPIDFEEAWKVSDFPISDSGCLVVFSNA
jgi:hypothetical protein